MRMPQGERERGSFGPPPARASPTSTAPPPPCPHTTHPLFPSRNSLQDALIAGTVRRFAVLVLDQNGLVVERFVAALAVRPEILASVEPEDVEAALRSCLLKLQFLETSLEPLPAGASREERGREERRGEVGMAWARRVSSPHFERREAVGAPLSLHSHPSFLFTLYRLFLPRLHL